mgnify:CR=1 FL=1
MPTRSSCRTGLKTSCWHDAWRAFHGPVEIAGTWLRPPWLDEPANALMLEPGYAFGTGAEIWWRQNADALGRIANLAVVYLPPEATRAMAKGAERSMALQCTIQEGRVWLSFGGDPLDITPEGKIITRIIRKAYTDTSP